MRIKEMITALKLLIVRQILPMSTILEMYIENIMENLRTDVGV